MKFVKANSMPLDKKNDVDKIKSLAEKKIWKKAKRTGPILDVSVTAKESYIEKIFTFFDYKKIKPLRILVNGGHGVAGPMINLSRQNFLIETGS